MNIRKLVSQTPFLVGLDNADAWSEIVSFAFDREIEDKQSPFSAEKHKDTWDRSKYFRSMQQYVPAHQQNKFTYILSLLTLASAIHDGHEVKEDFVRMLQAAEPFYPDVSDIVSVNELLSTDAATAEVWN